MIRVYSRPWPYLLVLAALLVALFAPKTNPLSAGNNGEERPDRERSDRSLDNRNGDRFGRRQVLVFDNFSQRRGVQLAGRDPVIAPRDSVWQVELGDWQIKRGYLREFSPEPWSVASDKRAYINAARADVQVSSRIQYHGGEQFVGVVARYAGEVDWLMFWYDGHGSLVLGAKKTDSDSDFHDLQRVPYTWETGKKHTLHLVVRDQNIRAYVDKNLMMELNNVPVVGDATYAGIYSRGVGSAKFENFQVSGLERIKNVDRANRGNRNK